MRPNLIIIGAMKAGTTSLHYYLGRHPQIEMSRRKELNFFAEQFNWSRGIEWYEAQFRGGTPVRGESSPSYTNHPHTGGVPQRMHAIVPDAKLIYVLRDPVERIVSQYIHGSWMGFENKDFREAITDPKGTYLSRSRYYHQLEQYLPYYPRERMLVMTDEELLGDRRATLRKVFRFLEVDETFDSPLFDRKLHKSEYKRRKTPFGLRIAKAVRKLDLDGGALPIRSAHVELVLCYPFSHKIERPTVDRLLRGQLLERLADDHRQLREFTGRDFAEWQGT
jgi:hypothetical protein